MTNSHWLSLSEAAALLGVHYSTLRRWTNAGLVEHIRTPGRKRMYSPEAIHDFINRSKATATKPQAVELFRTEVVAKTHQVLHSRELSNKSWYIHLSDDHRLRMRDSGNRLIALMLQYCTRDTSGEVFLKEGERIAQEYGQFCLAAGMTLAECTRTFLFFRRSMLNAIHETGSLQGMNDISSQSLFRRLNNFLDEIMVSMVSEYSSS